MRRFQTGCVAVCVLWASSVWSQTTNAEGYNRNAWQHCWALQFSVSNASLQSFDGASIAVRRHFGPGSALRLGVTVGEIAFTETRVEDPNTTRQQETNHQHGGFDIEYVGFIGPKTNVTPLLVVGSSFDAHRQELEGRSVQKQWAVGLNAGFGVEWFVHHRISVSGEYLGSLFYRWGSTDDYYGSQHARYTQESVGLGDSRVRMGVAVSL